MQAKHLSIIALLLVTASCAERPMSMEASSPESRESPVAAKESMPAPPSEPPGTSYDNAHRWDLSDPTATKALSGTPFGEQEIAEYWVRKGWRLTKKEDRFNATVDQLLADQKITKSTHWAQSPFTPVYKASETVSIEGVRIPKGTEFWLDTNENEDEMKLGSPLFKRMDGYQEEHQGHVDQASDARDGEHRSGAGKH